MLSNQLHLLIFSEASWQTCCPLTKFHFDGRTNTLPFGAATWGPSMQTAGEMEPR